MDSQHAGSLIHWACFGSMMERLIQTLGCHYLNALHCLGTPVGICNSMITMYAAILWCQTVPKGFVLWSKAQLPKPLDSAVF